jgi:hypothetical protein
MPTEARRRYNAGGGEAIKSTRSLTPADCKTEGGAMGSESGALVWERAHMIARTTMRCETMGAPLMLAAIGVKIDRHLDKMQQGKE